MALVEKPRSLLSLLGMPEQSSVMNTMPENAAVWLADLLGLNAPSDSIMSMAGPMMMVGKGAKGFEGMRRFSNLADKMERAEISDAGAKMVKDKLDPDAYYRLVEILSHKELYDKYPQLKNLEV